MKRLLSLALALALVLSLALPVFAATTHQALADSNGYFNTKGLQITVRTGKNIFDSCDGDVIPYGETIYLPLKTLDGAYVTTGNAVADLKLRAAWDRNGSYVESVSLVRKDSYYCFAIQTTGSVMTEKDVEGTISVTGMAYNANGTKVKLTRTDIDLTITLGFEYASDLTASATPRIFDFEELGEQEEDCEINFEEDRGVYFTVDTSRQTKLLLAMDREEDENVASAYSDAYLDFYNFNGAVFKKTGTLVIPAEYGSYLYQIVDGALQSVSATYDSYDESFSIKTNTLGRYVVSDTKLGQPDLTPGDIYDIDAIAGESQVIVTWTPSANAAGYQLQRQTDGGSWQTLSETLKTLSFTDTAVKLGSSYCYRVRGTNSTGTGPWATGSDVDVTIDKPGPIATLKTTAGADRVTLTWSVSSGAKSYLIQRQENGGSWKTISSACTSTSFVDTDVSIGSTYCYRVKGRNTAGYGSLKTGTPVTLTVPTPGVISSVTTTAADGKITVTWTASANAAQYELQRRVYSGGVWSAWETKASTLTARTYTDTAVVGGTVYQYRVRGRNGSVYGAYRNGTSTKAYAATPGAIASLTATPSSGKIAVTWTSSANAAQYELQRRIYSGGVWSSWATVSNTLTATSYNDTAVTGGTVYQYRVRGRNGSVYGSYRNGTSTKAYAATPGAIASLTTAASAGRMDVTWSVSSEATQYILQRRDYVDGVWSAWITLNSTLVSRSYVDTALIAGRVYQYRVRGRSGSVYGPFKAGTSTKALAPDVPPGSIANVSITFATGRITVHWSASSNATAYILQRRENGGAWVTLTGSLAATSYVDTAIAVGHTYQYRVRGRNANGYGDFKASATVTTA